MDLSIKKLINDFSSDELMFEYPNKGLLRLTGKDSFKFLNGISSNEVKNLKGEQSISSLILTNKGRILFHIEIFFRILLEPCDMADVLESLTSSKFFLLFLSKIITLCCNFDSIRARVIPTKPEPTMIMLC